MTYKILETQDDTYWVEINPENGNTPLRYEVGTLEEAFLDIKSYHEQMRAMYPEPKKDGTEEFN